MKEKLTCFKCSKKNSCKFFEIVPQKKDDGDRIASIRDLQIVLHGLYNNTLPYKKDSGLNMKKLSSEKKEKEKEKEKKKIISEANKNQTNTNPVLDDTDPNVAYLNKVLKRIPNKDWNSANILMELMNETIEDLVHNNGIVLKTLINSIIESKRDEEQTELLGKEADEKVKQKQNDPYVKLLEDIKECKNRREKRRLLARFNQQVGFGWGEYRTIINTKMYDNNEEDAKTKETDYNVPAPFREPGSIYTNQGYISEKNLRNIDGSRNQRKMVTEHFSQKVNMKNAQYKFITGQQNLSLLMNQSRENTDLLSDSNEKSYVKVPGAEYRKAVNYLNYEDSEKVEDFKNFVDDKRSEYTVDIRKTINKKLNKVDRKLEENKKFTLKKQIENVEFKEKLLVENETHKLALNEFENSYKLEGESNNTNTNNILSYNSENSSSIRNSSNKLEEINKNSLSLSKTNSNVGKTINITNEMESIQFYKQTDMVGSGIGMEFYKQHNIDRQEKVERGQELSKIKNVMKNKHIYKAHNYYNNTNLEHLPYEKDADFSRAMQFAKTIKKEVSTSTSTSTSNDIKNK